jgi:ribosome biogenesis protein MAK21
VTFGFKCCGFLTAYIQLFNTTPGLRDLFKDNEVKRSQTTVPEDVNDPPKGDGSYDPKKRDPQWANAHRTCLWELVSTILRSRGCIVNVLLFY